MRTTVLDSDVQRAIAATIGCPFQRRLQLPWLAPLLVIVGSLAVCAGVTSPAAFNVPELAASFGVLDDHSGVDANVEVRGLVAVNVTAADILNEHAKYCANVSRRRFVGDSLAFLSTESPRSLALVRKFRAKLTFVAPEWFVARPFGGGGAKLSHVPGVTTDAKATLVALLGGGTAVVPRVSFASWSRADFTRLVEGGSRGATSTDGTVAGAVVEACKVLGVHGATIDLLPHVDVDIVERHRAALYAIVCEIGDALRRAKMIAVLLAPPVKANKVLKPEVFAAADFKATAEHYDRIVLLTADYATARHPGPAAPVPWIIACVRALMLPSDYNSPLAVKLLITAQFHGLDFGGGSGGGSGQRTVVNGTGYLKTLARRSPTLRWDDRAMEHEAVYRAGKAKSQHRMFYPSLLSIARRLQLARRLGVGVAIDEIGQGLDYFLDLL